MKKLIAIILLVVSTQTLALPTTYDAVTQLSWGAVTTKSDGSPLLNLAGYYVYSKSLPDDPYVNEIRIQVPPSQLNIMIRDMELMEGSVYYSVITAFDTDGMEGQFSDELVFTLRDGIWRGRVKPAPAVVSPFRLLPQN